MSRIRLVLIIAIVLGVIGAMFLLAKTAQKSVQVAPPSSQKISVVTSFYPLAEFAKTIGGEHVSVKDLTPAGVEPHEFEPTPQDLVSLHQSRVFVYNGAGFEKWTQKVLPELQQEKIVVINASENIPVIQTGSGAESINPHVWVSPILAQQEVDAIAKGLIEADPSNSTVYTKNADALKQKLQQLDQEYQSGIKNCERRDVIASHDAFGYLAKPYNLHIVPISGLSPDTEPTPKEMSDIITFAKQHHVTHIFFETLVSPRLSQTIADEVHAQTLVFNPIEGLTAEDEVAGKNYFSIQRENIANLRTALKCQ